MSVEDELNQIVFRATVPEGEITSFADVYGNWLAGKKNIVTEISGSLDMALSQGDATIFALFGAGPKTALFDPTGSGAGADTPVYTCTSSGLNGVLLSSYRISLPVGGAATYQATLQHSGLTSRSVA